MADTTRVPVKTETGSASVPQALRPFDSLRREVDRLFEDFAGGFWRSPFGRSFFDIEPAWRSRSAMSAMPAIDVTETDKAYEITAELPGMDEKNVEVKVVDDILTIKGEKQEEKEEKKRTTISANAGSGHSNVPLRYPRAWTKARSRRTSRRACSR